MNWGASAAQLKAVRLLAQPQRHTMLVGGSRSRKTFTFVRSTCIRALRAPRSRHLIARFRANAVHASIALDTFPKVMETCFPHVPFKLRSDGYFALPGQSQVWLGGLDDKERVDKILGNEYATIFLNECSQIPYSTVVTVRTRLAQVIAGLRQRMYYDLNPVGKAHWTSKQFVHLKDPVTDQPLSDPTQFAHLFLNPRENPTLDPAYLAELESLPDRQRRRFLLGEYVEEVEGALWTYEIIERNRVLDMSPEQYASECDRIVVIVDPSGAAAETDYNNDEIGIVVVGRHGRTKDAAVLADYSLRAAPAVWGRVAVKAYRDFNADTIIAEQNFGGEMVRFVIQAADKNVPCKVITASRGKVVRAEPVSAMYEKNRVKHIGRFPKLEDQLCAFSTLGYTGSDSPDRADGAVWGVTELIIPQTPGAEYLIEHMKREASEAAAKAKGNRVRDFVKASGAPQAEVASPVMASIAAASDGNVTNKTYDMRGDTGRKHAQSVADAAPALAIKPQDPSKKYSSFSAAQADAS